MLEQFKQESEYVDDNHPLIQEKATELFHGITDAVADKQDIEEITFRSFMDDDMELFKTWLAKPYVARFYHDPEDWIDELERRDTEYHWITHCIVEIGGKPIGFCQYYLYERSMSYGEDWQGTVPIENTYSLDYLIGEEEYIGKGYGKQMVLKLIHLIRREGTAKRIIVQPEEENAPSCNTLLSCGFRFDTQNRLYIIENF